MAHNRSCAVPLAASRYCLSAPRDACRCHAWPERQTRRLYARYTHPPEQSRTVGSRTLRLLQNLFLLRCQLNLFHLPPWPWHYLGMHPCSMVSPRRCWSLRPADRAVPEGATQPAQSSSAVHTWSQPTPRSHIRSSNLLTKNLKKCQNQTIFSAQREFSFDWASDLKKRGLKLT